MRFLCLAIAVYAVAASPGQTFAANSPVSAAVANPDRLEGDSDADGRRKPGDVLDFFGIEPDMQVLEMFAGGGYYTEILSYLVGPRGRVVAQNNTPYLGYAKKTLDRRFTPGRLENVDRLTAENNELDLPAGRFDAALFILAYHDVYYVDDAIGWAQIDGPALLAEVYQALKPGAVVGVVDHVATAGAPAEVGTTLHRIDPALLRSDFEAAGFVFDAEAELLRNPQDDHDKPVFAPEIRGNTDRFVYRFHKP